MALLSSTEVWEEGQELADVYFRVSRKAAYWREIPPTDSYVAMGDTCRDSEQRCLSQEFTGERESRKM